MRRALMVMLIVILGSAPSLAGTQEWGRSALDAGTGACRGTERFFGGAGSTIGHVFMETGRATGHGFSVFGREVGRAFIKTGEVLGRVFGTGGVCVGRSARTGARTIADLLRSPRG